MKSIKTNILLNFINTLTGIIFPVITFPYAARILLPEGIGTVNFLNSIVNYLVLFTSLGIPLYAVREVARYRDDKDLKERITVELIILSVILCAIGYIGVALLAEFVPQINHQAKLFYILSLAIIFNAIGVNWFYQAVEDFKFITIRGIIVRVICAVSLFVFVKSPADLSAYCWITVGFTVGNNILNFLHLPHLIEFKSVKYADLNLSRHIKPTLRIFVLNVIVSIYLNLNVVMLGLIIDETAVGIYTAGNKITFIVLSLVTSIGTVLLPRCSNLVTSNKRDEFVVLIRKSLYFVIGFSLPCILGLIFLAKPFIIIFCGAEFLPASTVLILTAPIILIIGTSNVLGIQVLYPLGKENYVIWSTIGGALANLLINFWLIPKFSYIGASVSTLIAEFIVTLIQIIFTIRFIPEIWNNFNINNYLISSILMSAGIFLLLSFLNDMSPAIQLILTIPCGVIIYLSYLLYKKDSVAFILLNFFRKK